MVTEQRTQTEEQIASIRARMLELGYDFSHVSDEEIITAAVDLAAFLRGYIRACKNALN